MPQGQLSAPQLLEALKPRPTRGPSKGSTKGTGSKPARSSGALPEDGFCVLGVTMADLFCDDDAVFTGGLACLTSRAGLFSFHRYVEYGGSDEGVRLLRACKTAAHEITHMFGVGHCLHRRCLMNGCGHLKEDFAAPPQLCPVDLAKLAVAVGGGFDLVARYEALLAFCEAQPSGFGEFAAWLRRALAATRGRPAPLAARSACRKRSSEGRKEPTAEAHTEESVQVHSDDDDDDDNDVMPLAVRLAKRQAVNR